MKRNDKPLTSPARDTILNGLDKLQTHHKTVLEQREIDVFLDRLKGYSNYQIETALERCLDETTFMPKLKEVRERIPEQRYPPENPGRFVTHGKPVLDEIRAIVLELYPKYLELDPVADKETIRDLFAKANRERYRRMDINPDNFKARKAGA